MIVLNSIDTDLAYSLEPSFSVPDLTKCISKKTIIDKGQVHAIGVLKLSTEAILIVNKKLMKTEKGRAFKTIFEELKKDLVTSNIGESHAFTSDEATKRILTHFGFSPCKGGEAFVYFP